MGEEEENEIAAVDIKVTVGNLYMIFLVLVVSVHASLVHYIIKKNSTTLLKTMNIFMLYTLPYLY